ncbi:hypothetical protein OJAV_G00209130 [Oryzias javanicus]|uniref:Uncharacterized protein n=1 Tax=Oryzias javanicus TaxID=123683 RepID=A0A3S2PDA2_ORYJA|nr:hypothetical protein OJAV_G00209130 [Oryzias javanicus]
MAQISCSARGDFGGVDCPFLEELIQRQSKKKFGLLLISANISLYCCRKTHGDIETSYLPQVLNDLY